MDPLLTTARECQALARFLGDRQNSDSTLKAREATRIVTALLDAGNQLERIAKERGQAGYEKLTARPPVAPTTPDAPTAPPEPPKETP